MIDRDERTILVTGATGNIGSEPARFSDNSLFISANLSSDTSGDLPALGRFFSPSKPESENLFNHLYVPFFSNCRRIEK